MRTNAENLIQLPLDILLIIFNLLTPLDQSQLILSTKFFSDLFKVRNKYLDSLSSRINQFSYVQIKSSNHLNEFGRSLAVKNFFSISEIEYIVSRQNIAAFKLFMKNFFFIKLACTNIKIFNLILTDQEILNQLFVYWQENELLILQYTDTAFDPTFGPNFNETIELRFNGYKSVSAYNAHQIHTKSLTRTGVTVCRSTPNHINFHQCAREQPHLLQTLLLTNPTVQRGLLASQLVNMGTSSDLLAYQIFNDKNLRKKIPLSQKVSNRSWGSHFVGGLFGFFVGTIGLPLLPLVLTWQEIISTNLNNSLKIVLMLLLSMPLLAMGALLIPIAPIMGLFGFYRGISKGLGRMMGDINQAMTESKDFFFLRHQSSSNNYYEDEMNIRDRRDQYASINTCRSKPAFFSNQVASHSDIENADCCLREAGTILPVRCKN